MLQTVKAQLGDAIELDTFSSVTSLPSKGGAAQGWHGDVSDLFPRTVIGEASDPRAVWD